MKLCWKQKAVVLSAVAIIGVTAAAGTAAYFTAESKATNVITAGSIKIELQEKMLLPDGEKTVPFEDRINVMPGEEVSKIVQIKNTGGQDAWIRVDVKKTIELANGEFTDGDGLTFTLNSDFWTEKNGFYYYNKNLAPGQETEPLFSSVLFDKNMGNDFQNSKAVITVTAYAAQTAHNGTSALDAPLWPQAD